MTLTGKVINASEETREMLSKDGKEKRKALIKHVLVMKELKGGGVEILNFRSYDSDWSLPKVGDTWESPRVKKYECYDGNVAEVMV